MSKLKDLMQPRSMFGLCIILLAFIIFFENLGINLFAKILGNWPLALIIIGIAILCGPKKCENRTVPYVLIIIGALFFLGQYRLFHFHMNSLILPLILLAIGIYILRPHLTQSQSGGIPANSIEIFSILGGGEFNTRSDNLVGGHAICILGGAEVDIREADMEGETMVISILAFMGGVNIKVPLHWQVNVQAVPLLGGVSNKTSCMADKLQMPKKSLVITGLAFMGGIELNKLMHPIFSHAKNLLAVTGLWLILSGLISYLLFLIQDIEVRVALVLYYPLLFIYFFFCLANYYICLELPLRQTAFARLVSTQFVAVASTVLIWLVCGYVYIFLLNQVSPGDWLLLYRSSTTSLGIIGAILYCFWILAHYIYLMAQQHDAMQRAALEKKLLISQTELQAVKATVHPHFLYNSLNTLANLSLVEPEKIHNICLQISEFLRYSVSYSQKETATVGEELDHIQNYLGIERERFGERLQTVFNVDENTRSEPMLPLLLFPLVENSIKHGIDSSLEGGSLEIGIEKNADTLCIHVRNPYDELGIKQNGTNIGLDSVRKRIQAHYGDQGVVHIERDAGTFSVNLLLPVQRRLQ